MLSFRQAEIGVQAALELDILSRDEIVKKESVLRVMWSLANSEPAKYQGCSVMYV